jgi:hypothetical protein
MKARLRTVRPLPVDVGIVMGEKSLLTPGVNGMGMRPCSEHDAA